MHRLVWTSLALVSVALAAPDARAQSFGRSGDVSFGADRLSGVYAYDDGPDFALFALGAGPTFGAHPYTTPRLGIDFFVIDHLSIGGSLAFWALSDGDDDGPGNNDNDFTGFLLYPRVGYALSFNDTFGFWPRGGLTFRTIEGNDEVALSFEANFFAIPVQHFGISFGPTLDVGLAGEGPEALVFGIITGGLFGYL
jgi:hypothetical protein